MILLDANILLYAYDDRSIQHAAIRPWLESQLSGQELIGLPWISAWAFLRISTNPRLSDSPLTADDAVAILSELMSHRSVVMVHPGRQHPEILLAQMKAAQVRGRETTDAILAALALENGATLASTDAGFRRFPNLTWFNPAGPQ